MKLLRRMRDAVVRREGIVGINRRNVDLVYAHNPRRYFPEADDKLLTKDLFERANVPAPTTIAVCRTLSAVVPTVNMLLERDQFVVKPAQASGGEGILVVGERVSSGVWRQAGGRVLHADELVHHMAEAVFGAFSGRLEDACFVEERVHPHAVFAALWPDGLCDLRIITLRGTPVFAMVRVPTRQSAGRANLHQGGLGLAIDLDTGRTVRAVHMKKAVDHHPESRAPLTDIELPAWSAVLDVATRAARALHLGYLGVDVVVDVTRGPLVLEVNARPGLEIQNVHGRGLVLDLARADA